MRTIVDVARLSLEEAQFRFKEKGTLQRHDIEISAIEMVYVRLTPRPDKRIIADVITGDAVFRCAQDTTLIDYRTFLDDIAPGGLENFRRFVGRCLEMSSHDADPATAEFANGDPPEAFAGNEELLAYDAYLRGDGVAMPKTGPSNGSSVPSKSSAEVERIWAEHADALRNEVSSASPKVDPRLGGLGLVLIGLVLGLGGVVVLLLFVTSQEDVRVGLVGILALGVLLGVLFMLTGLVMLRKAEQLRNNA